MIRLDTKTLSIAVPTAITVGAMVATPLARRGGAARRALSNVVVTGLFATSTSLAARRWGGARAGAAATGITAATAVVEAVGSRRGIPFGRYRYTDRLRPQVCGVPAVVPLAWFAMALPSREVAHAVLGRRSTRPSRMALGAAALTAWDLFLDPQMTVEGYWRWARRGRYRGIPATNFGGWFLVGLGVMAALEAALVPVDDADRGLVAQYAYVAAMESVGFAVFFRDRVVAAVGGGAMVPLAVVAMRRVWRRR
jgi:putative membrane protein